MEDPKVLDAIRQRQIAYKSVFNDSPAAVAVMEDLARFCRAVETTYDPDVNRTHILIGRNEVFKRIMEHIAMTPTTLYQRYGGPKL